MTNFDAAGGCLCRAIRFKVSVKPMAPCYCHCTMCQQHSGSLFRAVATVPIEGFSFTKGSPATYESSPGWYRLFCGTCGSTLGMCATENPKLQEFSLGCLDDLNLIKPIAHQYTKSQPKWLRMTDDLPRYTEVAPDVDELYSSLEGWQQPQ